jgi:hypothetical protein
MKALAFLVLITVSLPGSGQVSPPATLPARRVFTYADTLQALHALFRAGRSRGQVITALAPVALGVSAYSYSKMDLAFNWGTAEGGAPNGYAVAYMLAVPVGITSAIVGPLSWAHNTRLREQEAIETFEARKPLAPRLLRRLHRRLESQLPGAGNARP